MAPILILPLLLSLFCINKLPWKAVIRADGLMLRLPEEVLKVLLPLVATNVPPAVNPVLAEMETEEP